MNRALRTLIFGDKFRLLLVIAAVFCSASFAQQSRNNGRSGGYDPNNGSDYQTYREEQIRRQNREWEYERQRRIAREEELKKLGPPPACGIRVLPFESPGYNRPFRVSSEDMPRVTKLLEAKKYVVVDQEKYKYSTHQIPFVLDVSGSIDSYDLDVKIEYILSRPTMGYLYRSSLNGKVSCNSWLGITSEFRNATGILFGWSIYSRYYNRCDDGLDRSYYIVKKVTQGLIKRIAEMPDCPDANQDR